MADPIKNFMLPDEKRSPSQSRPWTSNKGEAFQKPWYISEIAYLRAHQRGRPCPGTATMTRLQTLLIASSLPLAASAMALGQPAPARPSSKTESIARNPFFVPSTLPFHAPPFNTIQESDYRPAIEEGMRQHAAEIERIANNQAAPTFKNTLVAMEKSGAMLARVMLTFGGVAGANTSDALQKLQEEMAPKLAAHQDSILLNAKLFNRI
ncbi:MAG: hypothetical protein KGN80_02160, partial [Acidobacteriota bacterium]|nr:hypothetical protein [Acidobacteriota bacterium]